MTGSDTPMDDIEGVGIVGTGQVGQWFVTNLVRAGFEPVVYDVDQDSLATAVERGGIDAKHPADLTDRTDIVLLALPTRTAVEEVMEGEHGVLDRLATGQIVVDAGSTPPDSDVHYNRLCNERDAGYVDCGITWEGPGEYDDAERGPAFQLFVGGDQEHYERARPVLEAIGYDHEFYEGTGNGHVVKAANRLRQTCHAAVAAEVVEFLTDNGIDPARVDEQLEWEIPQPFFDDDHPTTRGFDRASRTDEGDTEERSLAVDDTGAHVRLRTSAWASDPAYALEIAHAGGTHVPMLTAAFQTQRLAENYGRALLDRDLEFDDEWHASADLPALYRALNRPQEEWRRLGQSDDRVEPDDR